MAIGMYTAYWGPLRLYIEDISTDGGRHQVTHEPSRGDGYVTQDKGRVLRKVRTTLSFFDTEAEAKTGRERYEQFLEMVDGGDEQVFVHPFHGSFLAVVGPYTEDMSSREDAIRLACEFVPAEPFSPVADVGAGGIPVAGPEAVATLASEAATALETAGVASDLPAETAALATAWSEEEEVDSRRIYLEMGSQAAKLDALVTDYDLAALDTWEAYRSVMLLRGKLVDTAEALASEVSQTFDYVVEAAVPPLTRRPRARGRCCR
jgi:hypothetical protein